MGQYRQWLSKGILDDNTNIFTVLCKRCGLTQTRGSVQETTCTDRDRCNFVRKNLDDTRIIDNQSTEPGGISKNKQSASMVQNGRSDLQSVMGQQKTRAADDRGHQGKGSLGANNGSFTLNRSGQGSGLLTKTTQAFGAQGTSATASGEMLPSSWGHPQTLSDDSTSVTPGLSSGTQSTLTRVSNALVSGTTHSHCS